MPEKKRADVIVIGGGVIGSSVAYELSLRGISTLVLEKHSIASEASSAAAGMLAAQGEFIEEAPLFDLARKSRAMFPQVVQSIKEITGLDVGFVDRGLLRIANNNQDIQRYREQAERQHHHGLSAEWLSTEQALELEPFLSSSIKGALFIEGDSQVIAPQLTKAYARGAISLGAQFFEFTEVEELLYEHGQMIGVRVQDEVILCSKVVVASSIWSPRLLRLAGYDLPLSPVKGECVSVKLTKSFIQRTIYTDGCYLVPKANGELIIGATVKPRITNKGVTLGGISSLIHAAEQLVPSIRESEWISAWSGIRPITPTGLPYMGEHPEIDGLFIATGHYRNGILLSPATGVIIADLIEGKSIEDDLSPFAVPVVRYDSHNKIEGVSIP